MLLAEDDLGLTRIARAVGKLEPVCGAGWRATA
jgi:hypothetical protein